MFWIWWKVLNTIILWQGADPCCEQTHAAFEVGFSLDQGLGVYSCWLDVDGSSQLRLCHTCIIDVMDPEMGPRFCVSQMWFSLFLHRAWSNSCYEICALATRIKLDKKCEMWCWLTIMWWHHQMETFSALLAFCAGYSPATGQWHGALMWGFAACKSHLNSAPGLACQARRTQHQLYTMKSCLGYQPGHPCYK